MMFIQCLHLADQREAPISNSILQLQEVIALLNTTLKKTTASGSVTEGKQVMFSSSIKDGSNSTLTKTTISGNVKGGNISSLFPPIEKSLNSTLPKATTSS